jgi:hypothetical protein
MTRAQLPTCFIGPGHVRNPGLDAAPAGQSNVAQPSSLDATTVTAAAGGAAAAAAAAAAGGAKPACKGPSTRACVSACSHVTNTSLVAAIACITHLGCRGPMAAAARPAAAPTRAATAMPGHQAAACADWSASELTHSLTDRRACWQASADTQQAMRALPRAPQSLLLSANSPSRCCCRHRRWAHAGPGRRRCRCWRCETGSLPPPTCSAAA